MNVYSRAIEYMIQNKIEPYTWKLTRDKGEIKSLVYYENDHSYKGKRHIVPWKEVREFTVKTTTNPLTIQEA